MRGRRPAGAAVPILFGPMLLIHLAAVVVAFGIAPYPKFVHWVFRLLAIYQDDLERRYGPESQGQPSVRLATHGAIGVFRTSHAYES